MNKTAVVAGAVRAASGISFLVAPERAQLLWSQRPASDPFWRQYRANFEAFAKTEGAQPNIDTEVASVLTLAGAFLWPVWARSHARSATERRQLAQRYSSEVLRLCLHGTLRPEEFRELVEHVSK